MGKTGGVASRDRVPGLGDITRHIEQKTCTLMLARVSLCSACLEQAELHLPEQSLEGYSLESLTFSVGSSVGDFRD